MTTATIETAAATRRERRDGFIPLNKHPRNAQKEGPHSEASVKAKKLRKPGGADCEPSRNSWGIRLSAVGGEVSCTPFDVLRSLALSDDRTFRTTASGQFRPRTFIGDMSASRFEVPDSGQSATGPDCTVPLLSERLVNLPLRRFRPCC